MTRMRSTRTVLFAAALAGSLFCLSHVSLAAGAPQAQQGNAAANHAAQRLNGKDYKDVRVTVNNGVATLTGAVKLFEYKQKAGDTVAHTQGITSVNNQIQVAGPEISDAQLYKKLAPALAYNRVGYDNVFDAITLAIHNGVVVVGGQCHDYPNRNSALALVDSTPGVKDVIDHIVVDPPSTIDSRIRQEEERAIYGYPELNKYAINPEKPIRICVSNGHVSLYGAVDSAADRQIAYMQASRVPGVFSVKDYLQVPGQPSNQSGK